VPRLGVSYAHGSNRRQHLTGHNERNACLSGYPCACANVAGARRFAGCYRSRARILLDECVDSRLAALIPGHIVSTVAAKGWTGITNGKLLTLAQAEFDVFVTVDRKLSFQQHLPKYNVAVILVVSKWKCIDDLIGLVPELLEKLAAAPKGSLTNVGL
jgi:hypothetical protein